MSANKLKMKEALSQLEHDCHLNFTAPLENLRMTKIICTIGPSCQSVNAMLRMISEGMGIARINLSHESHEQHELFIENIREAAKQHSEEKGYNCHLAIAFDLKGPEMRTGAIENNGSVDLKRGDILKMSINSDLAKKGTRDVVYVDYRNIIYEVQIGNRVYIDDYHIVLEITEVGVDCLFCHVLMGGKLGSHKLVTVPEANFDCPPVTEKDSGDIKFAIESKADFIMVPKVKNADAVKEVRRKLGEKGKHIKIITKIENVSALENLDDIIAASDGILLARADLNIEMKPGKVFLVQKALAAKCNRVGRPLICGTEMLTSMLHRYQALRSDVVDVGNAILDGFDAIMLSSETAIGDYPVEAVKAAAYNCMELESALWFRNFFDDLVAHSPSVMDAAHSIAISAVRSAKSAAATAIIVVTASGKSAQLVSMYRPPCPIVAATRCGRVARQLNLCRGMFSVLVPAKRCTEFSYDTDVQVRLAMSVAQQMDLIHAGDPLVVVSTWRNGPGFTNTVRIVYADLEKDAKDCEASNATKATARVSH